MSQSNPEAQAEASKETEEEKGSETISSKPKKKKEKVKKLTKEEEQRQKLDMHQLMMMYAIAGYLKEKTEKDREKMFEELDKEERLLAKLSGKERKREMKKIEKRRAREKMSKQKEIERQKEKEAPSPFECFTEISQVTQCVGSPPTNPSMDDDRFGKFIQKKFEGMELIISEPEKVTAASQVTQSPTAAAYPCDLQDICPPPCSRWPLPTSALDAVINVYSRWLNLHFIVKYFLIMAFILYYFNGEVPHFLPRSFPINLFFVLYLDANYRFFNYIPGLLLLFLPLEKVEDILTYIEKVAPSFEDYSILFVLLLILLVLTIQWGIEFLNRPRNIYCPSEDTSRFSGFF